MRSSGSGALAAIMLASVMSHSTEPEPSWLDDINIFEEYELIKQKKSRLSRSKREQIVRLRESMKN